MFMSRLSCGVFLGLVLSGDASSLARTSEDASLRGDSPQTRKRLAEAEQKLLAGKTSDAVEDLQRIIEETGDDLVTFDGEQYRTARWFAHELLAKLPAEALRNYQDRIDDPARKLLETAKRTRELSSLWQLLDRYFVSRPAGEALLLLGDLLFERGEFRTAEIVWKRLLSDAGADIVHPTPKAEPADVKARVILAAIFQGEADRARAELVRFQTIHPDAKGVLAGQTGRYSDILAASLKTPPRISLAANPGTDWPMFGGAPDRSSRVERMPRFLPDQPTWKTALPTANEARHHELPLNPPRRPPFGNPVIAQGVGYVSDGYELFGFDLISGKMLVSLSLLNRPNVLTNTPDASPTIAAFRDRLFVRAGPGAVRPGVTTSIVCLQIIRGIDDKLTLKELWRLKPPVTEEKSIVSWEGAPLIVNRRMWAIHARFEGGRIVHGISCYDPIDSKTPPERPTWSADVSEVQTPIVRNTGDTETRSRHELLTLAGRHIVFNSNAGLVIALDASTGRRAWGFRYPRGRKPYPINSADPAPAVVSGGRVFVAPADAEHVYALDPECGRVLWTSGRMEGSRIVGVSAGRLIVAAAGRVRGLRGLSVASGSYHEPEGWLLHDGGGLLGYGQGFATDDVIVWPTREGVYLLPSNPTRSTLGSVFRNRLGGWQQEHSGNVVFADGVLVLVTPTQVVGYVSESRLHGPPNARSESEAFQRQVALAEEAAAKGETASARTLLLEVATNEFSRSYRAWAIARLLLLAPRGGARHDLPDDIRLAVSPEIMDEWIIPADGIPITLEKFVNRYLDREQPTDGFHHLPSFAADNKSIEATSLSPNAEIIHNMPLQAGAAPLRWISGTRIAQKHVFVTSGADILAISIAHRDATRHAANDQFTHASGFNSGFVAAGPFAVAVYSKDRSPLWVFRVPNTDPLPATAGEFRFFSDRSSTREELSSFRLMGSWLFARLGQRHIIALDLLGHRVVWVLGANGQPGYRPYAFETCNRFAPEFATTDRFAIAQLSNGRRWTIQLRTGKRLDLPVYEDATAKTWWTGAPEEIEENKVLVVDGPGVVKLLNLATGRLKWIFRFESEVGLTGQSLQFRAWQDWLLIAIQLNHGTEILKLDATNGHSVWPCDSVFLDLDRVNLANADFHSELVFVPVGNSLAAISLRNGNTAWEVDLPEAHGAGGWVVRAGTKCLIVYPEQAIPREPIADVISRLSRSFRQSLDVSQLPIFSAALYDAWVARTVPVLLIDPATGKQLQQIDIPARGPSVTVSFEQDQAVFVTGDRVVWMW